MIFRVILFFGLLKAINFQLYSQNLPNCTIPFDLILITLKTDLNRLEIIKQKGFVEEAKKIENKIKKQHSKIKSDFKNFTYCPIYFYYSHHEDSLIQNNTFLNQVFNTNDSFITNQNHIKSIQQKKFIILEYNTLSNENLSIPAIIFYNNKKEIFSKPCTYYVRTSFLFFNRKNEKVMLDLKNNLEKIRMKK